MYVYKLVLYDIKILKWVILKQSHSPLKNLSNVKNRGINTDYFVSFWFDNSSAYYTIKAYNAKYVLLNAN